MGGNSSVKNYVSLNQQARWRGFKLIQASNKNDVFGYDNNDDGGDVDDDDNDDGDDDNNDDDNNNDNNFDVDDDDDDDGVEAFIQTKVTPVSENQLKAQLHPESNNGNRCAIALAFLPDFEASFNESIIDLRN